MTNLQATVKLNNGVLIPSLGLGVWKTTNEQTAAAVETAIANGYCLIDTAKQYGNEAGVGNGLTRGLAKSGRQRQDLFLTTKIFNGDQGNYDKLRTAFNQQLAALQTNYVDLLLLHWPVNDKYNESWRALEAIYKDGQARAIGVCNFDVERMHDLLDHASIKPAINQIEFNPLIHQPAIVEDCQKNSINIEAWSPLGNGRLLQHPLIAQLAEKYHKTAAQIILRWVIQQDVIVITKTTHANRMKENAAIFDFTLAPADVALIDQLDEEKHSIWYDKYKWSGNPDGVDDYVADPDHF